MKTKILVQNLLIGFFGGFIAFLIVLLIVEKSEYNLFTSVNRISNSNELTATPVSFPMRQNVGVDLTFAAQKSVDAVVHVTTLFSRQVYGFSNPFLDFFFGNQGRQFETRPSYSSGSGVIISEEGYIVTNCHVIENAEKIEITLNNKKNFEAYVVGTDKNTDIALLKINENNLPFLEYGDSDSLKVGEWVLAVGNPFNLTSTVTAGIVSAKARNINLMNKKYSIESFIQTDAAVNPGNSGGALVNTRGELVGINTAIASQTGSFTGYSFAVPISIVQKVVADLMEFGEVQRAFLGVIICDINSQIAKEHNLKTMEGVLIIEIEKESAAEKSGLKVGDIITAIGNSPVRTNAEFQDRISRLRPGQETIVSINRAGKTFDVKTVFQNYLGTTSIVEQTDLTKLFGSTLKAAQKKDIQHLGISGGVEVVAVENGIMKNAGIRKGFIITFINGIKILNPQDIAETIKKSKNRVVFIEGVYYNGQRAIYTFGLD